jgi:16S rRNA (cytosine1402-N4)-methyltransferase
VLLREVIDLLAPRPDGLYIDATAGGGGHSEALLRHSTPNGKVLSLDADPIAVGRVNSRLAPFGDRSITIAINFRRLVEAAQMVGFVAVDGILFDLGISSDQLADTDRGFALQVDGSLDMRFDPLLPLRASDLLNNMTEANLANLIHRYGEERHSRRIARSIVAARPIHSSRQLAEVIADAIGKREKIHPATRAFQALRIAVNDELGALAEALPQAVALLRPGGRLAVISFHSLEDRLTKQFMVREATDCLCPPTFPVCVCEHQATLRVITRKPIQPSHDEIASNPRSRSAKLRVAKRLPEVDK